MQATKQLQTGFLKPGWVGPCIQLGQVSMNPTIQSHPKFTWVTVGAAPPELLVYDGLHPWSMDNDNKGQGCLL